MATRKLEVKIVGDAKSLERTFGKAARDASLFGAQVDRAGVGLARLGGTVAKGAAVGIAGVAGSVAFAGFRFDDMKQKAEIAFTTMLKDGGKAKAFLGDLQAFATKTPFEFPELVSASQKLLAMGFTAKQIIPSMTAIGDAVAGLGGSAETLDQVTRALGQIQAKGKASAEEMLQLTEAGIDAWKYLAQAIGTDVAGAMAKVSKGAVDSGTTIKAVITGMERDFGGMMDKQSHTFSGVLSNLKDTFGQVSGQVMQPFFERATAGMQRLADYTNSREFHQGIERFTTWIEQRAIPAVDDVSDGIVDHWPEIQDALEGIADFGKDAARALELAAKGADKVADAVGGWENAAKIILSGALGLKLASIGNAAAGVNGTGGAAGKVGTLEKRLRSLNALPAIVVGIELAMKLKIADKTIGQTGRDLETFLDDLASGKNARAIAGDLLNLLFGGKPSGGLVGSRLFGEDEHAPGVGSSGIVPQPGGGPTDRLTGSGSTSGKGGIQLGTYHAGGATHETSGLPGYPAIDIMAKAGTPIRAPEDGRITRVRPFNPDPAFFGMAIYYYGTATGNTYYIKHIAGPAPVGNYKKGDVIAYVAHGTQNGDHVHYGINKGSGVATPQPTTTTPARGGTSGGGFDDSAFAGGNGGAGSTKTKPDITAIPAKLRLMLAKAEGTKGLRDDLEALQQIEALLEGRMAKTKDAGDKADLQERLNQVRGSISSINEELGKTEKAREALRMEKLAEQSRKAIEAAKDALAGMRAKMDQAFQNVASKALAAFDRETQRLLKNAKVQLFGGEFGAGDETPAERKLRERREQRHRDDQQRRLAEAQTEEEKQAILAEIEDEGLEEEARKERAAAEEALAQKRQEIEDERTLMRERFQNALADLGTYLSTGKTTTEEGVGKIKTVLEQFGVDLGPDGAFVKSITLGMGDASAAFSGVASAIEGVIAAMARLRATQVSAAPGSGVVTQVGGGDLPFGVQFNVPKFAAGGIVTRPTLGLVGEAGPEAIVPLSGAGLGDQITLNVYVDTVYGDDRRRVAEYLVDEIHTALLQKKRRTGSLNLS